MNLGLCAIQTPNLQKVDVGVNAETIARGDRVGFELPSANNLGVTFLASEKQSSKQHLKEPNYINISFTQNNP
jgi:hypothetical protein